MTATFAIAMPVGPGENPWLQQALRSIAAQSADVRVAICAVERSAHVEAAVQEFSSLIDYVRYGADDGQSAAINEGWAALDARYYGWLNDDDMLHPDALLRALEAFGSGADVVHGRTDILRDGRLLSGYGDAPVGEGIYRDNVIAQPSTFVTRDALEAVSGRGRQYLDPDLHYTMDWGLWCRLFAAGKTFQAIPQSLSITRWYDDTKTAELSSERLSETYTLVRRYRGLLPAAWSQLNIMIHTRAQSERASIAARAAMALLQRLHGRRGETGAELDEEQVELFHYEDAACEIDLGDDEKMMLPPGQALHLKRDSLAVPFT